jgi:hypothetical protein
MRQEELLYLRTLYRSAKVIAFALSIVFGELIVLKARIYYTLPGQYSVTFSRSGTTTMQRHPVRQHIFANQIDPARRIEACGGCRRRPPQKDGARSEVKL